MQVINERSIASTRTRNKSTRTRVGEVCTIQYEVGSNSDGNSGSAV